MSEPKKAWLVMHQCGEWTDQSTTVLGDTAYMDRAMAIAAAQAYASQKGLESHESDPEAWSNTEEAYGSRYERLDIYPITVI